MIVHQHTILGTDLMQQVAVVIELDPVAYGDRVIAVPAPAGVLRLEGHDSYLQNSPYERPVFGLT